MNERDDEIAKLIYGTQATYQEMQFAALIRADEREKCSKARAGKPRILPSVGTGALWKEQAYCFAKGWHEGAASVRKAIRARGNT